MAIPTPTNKKVFEGVPSQMLISGNRNTPSELNVQNLVDVPEPDDIVSPTQEAEPFMHLRIARLGVDAPIREVGLAMDGSMAVPKNPFDTGWYKQGPLPGEIGSAVITGHVDSITGAPAVFANLDHLAIGDIIEVEGAQTTYTFRIREIRTYPAEADATDIFTSADGKAHLNLITCSGSWDANTKQYTDRLVIFTNRVL